MYLRHIDEQYSAVITATIFSCFNRWYRYNVADCAPVTFLKIAASQVVFIDLSTNQIMSLRIVSWKELFQNPLKDMQMSSSSVKTNFISRSLENKCRNNYRTVVRKLTWIPWQVQIRFNEKRKLSERKSLLMP